jgi:protein TonB
MHGKAIPLLRSFGFVCVALAVGSGAALAEDGVARVDPVQDQSQMLYPDSARAAGEQGTVLIDVLVRPSGHASKFKVAQSSGFGDLDEAALESVMNWHYVPAVRDGDKVTDWATVKVVFQLPPAPSAPPSQ